MKVALGLLACVMAVVGQAGTAGAAAVKPSGKYAFTTIDTCEAQFGFTSETVKLGNGTNGPAVKIINSQHNGHIGTGVGYITFTPSSGTFTFSLTNVHGGALNISNYGGVNVLTETQNVTGTYTYTPTSMTLTPTNPPLPAMTFTMVYGALNAANIPSSVHLARQDSSGETTNCVQSITATK